MRLRTAVACDLNLGLCEGRSTDMRKVALLGVLLLMASSALAYEHTDGHYTAADKFGRGMAEVTTGFLELPGNMVAISRDKGTVSGMTIGFAKGLGMIPLRELVGVYDILSSPFAPPGHYDPVIEPQF